ncbi:hypothetical protein [Thalassobacillus hwangdonensis]|uniref:Zinc-finger domain-containing protein n=1 Tax=Thalassobacillus hwangdonensis TaxID=546108 RepID=A0ABW3L5D5_9BACI
MMVNKDIHLLCEEVLPIYEDLSEDAKKVVERHLEECPVCKASFDSLSDEEDEDRSSDHINGRPFTKLIWLKRSGFFFILLFKIIVLGLIAKEFFQLNTTTEAPLGLLDEGVRANMVLFYLPLAIAANAISLFLVKKRYIAFLFILDVILLFTYDTVLLRFAE